MRLYALPVWHHGLQTHVAHGSSIQEVPLSMHTFLILPFDTATCVVTMAGT